MEVRPATGSELEATIRVLRGAGLGTYVGRLLDFPRLSPCGEVLVAQDGHEIAGGAAVVAFGATGWIGALGVAPHLRRRGTGTALTRGCVDWLRGRGVDTVLLYATASGLPVYRRAGFVADGDAHAWRDVAPPGGNWECGDVRAMSDADMPAVRALDRRATGEDRAPVFDALGPSASALVLEREGRVAASALRSPWGLGPSVVADDVPDGLALLSALRRTSNGPLTLSLPDANVEAVRTLRSWGLQTINVATRMRLGPAPPYDPRRVFGMFNLFWG